MFCGSPVAYLGDHCSVFQGSQLVFKGTCSVFFGGQSFRTCLEEDAQKISGVAASAFRGACAFSQLVLNLCGKNDCRIVRDCLQTSQDMRSVFLAKEVFFLKL